MKKFLLLSVAGAALLLGFGSAGAAEVPVSTGAASAQPTRQVIGDWVVACEPPSKGHKSCVMSQTLSSEKLKKTVSVLTIGKDQTGKLKGSLRVPVGVSLPAGVVVGIESQNAFTIPYTACHRIGCFAPFDLTEPMLGQMRKASKISAVAQSVSKQALNLNFSTRGFPSAYETYLKESK
jgi:invasion protein IalB